MGNDAGKSASKPAGTPEERRAFPRRAAKGTALCRGGKLALGRPIRGFLLDIAPDSVGIVMPTELKVGEPMDLELSGIGSTKPVHVRAIVRDVNPHAGGTWRVGWEFEKRLTYEQLAGLVR